MQDGKEFQVNAIFNANAAEPETGVQGQLAQTRRIPIKMRADYTTLAIKLELNQRQLQLPLAHASDYSLNRPPF